MYVMPFTFVLPVGVDITFVGLGKLALTDPQGDRVKEVRDNGQKC